MVTRVRDANVSYGELLIAPCFSMYDKNLLVVDVTPAVGAGARRKSHLFFAIP